MDYDIGMDTWPIVVAVCFGVLSLFMIITFKCAPQVGIKMYSGCCPKLMENVNKRPEGIGAQHQKKVEMKEDKLEAGEE